MDLNKVFCTNCGAEIIFNVEKKDFCFCTECGNKIILNTINIADVQHENNCVGQDISITNNNLEIDKKLEEVEFYYTLSVEKKEYENFFQEPFYYIKAQDILVDLSEIYPNDYRIWWELCKPIDWLCSSESNDFEDKYKINEGYFNRALDKAELSQKRMLIEEHDRYIKNKETAKSIAKQKQIEEERKRKAKELEEQKIRNRQLEEEKIRNVKELEKQKIRTKQLEEEKIRKAKELEEQKIRNRQLEDEEKRKAKELEEQKIRNRQLEKEKIRKAKELEEQKAAEKQEQEKRITTDAELAALNVSLWSNLSQKKYSAIDNTYFKMPLENNQTIIGIFKLISNMLYLSAFRIDGNKSNTIYREQSLAIQFDEKGRGIKFDRIPIKIKGLLPPENILRITNNSSNELFVSNMPLKSDAEYVSGIMKSAKNPLFAFTKIFI